MLTYHRPNQPHYAFVAETCCLPGSLPKMIGSQTELQAFHPFIVLMRGDILT